MGQDFHVCQTKPGGVQQAGGFIISGVQRAMNAMEHCITKRPALQPISRFSSLKIPPILILRRRHASFSASKTDYRPKKTAAL